MAFRKSNVPGEDIRRAMEMPEKRRQLIAQTPAEPLPETYAVNELAKALHPGFMKAELVSKESAGTDSCRFTFRSLRKDGRFPFFRAGQFITLSAKVRDSFLTRPYSIASSPKEALDGQMEVIIQRKGIFSSYMIDEAQTGDEFIMGEPSGDFCHDDLRDCDHILAIAGGSGITPFLSMMKAIREGSEDFRLTLLYGVRSRKQMLFDPEEFRDDRIRIETVLSDEEAEGYRHGFITSEILKEYVCGDTSVFLCGPDAMYRFVRQELESLGFPPERVRQERNSVGDREVAEDTAYLLTVHIRDDVRTVAAKSSETVITALERAGIPAVVRCRNGVCGFCHSRVVRGSYYVAPENDFRRAADRKFNYIHPCSTYPLSDLEIEIPIFDA